MFKLFLNLTKCPIPNYNSNRSIKNYICAQFCVKIFKIYLYTFARHYITAKNLNFHRFNNGWTMFKYKYRATGF